jgi:hypothetical protein
MAMRLTGGCQDYGGLCPVALPDILIETFESDAIESLRPALDARWQTGDWASYFE